MKVQRFRAPSFAEALRQVKEALGDDAVILESRAVQEEGDTPQPEGRRAWRWLGLKSELRPPAKDAKPKEVEITAAIGQAAQALVSHSSPPPDTTPSPAPSASNAPKATSSQAGPEELPPLSDALTGFADQLVQEEVEASLVEELLGGAMMALSPEALEAEAPILDHLIQDLFRRLSIFNPPTIEAGPRVMALVGPPGLGKTTTCAKIAAMAALGEKKKVAILTLAGLDAQGQGTLKRTAKILGCPFSAISDAETLAQAMTAFAEVDLLIVDTPSCSPYDTQGISLIDSLLGVFPDCDIHLVLSPALRDRDLQASVKGFGSIGAKALIFTGLDIAACYGGILNACEGANLPLSYFAYGSEIPGDLEVATRERVVDLLLNLSARG